MGGERQGGGGTVDWAMEDIRWAGARDDKVRKGGGRNDGGGWWAVRPAIGTPLGGVAVEAGDSGGVPLTRKKNNNCKRTLANKEGRTHEQWSVAEPRTRPVPPLLAQPSK